MARTFYLAWRYGKENPYLLFNGLERDYRPVGGGEDEPPRPPPYPWRIRAFILACANYAHEERIEALEASVAAGAGGGMM